MTYLKASQTAKTKPTKKKCSECSQTRDMRFFSSKRARACGDCKRKRWALALKNSPKKLRDKAWDAFARYIRHRDALKTCGSFDFCICISCGSKTPFKSIQAGHFVSGRTGSVLFEEDLVFGQCLTCNVFLRGNYQLYTLRMIEMVGIDEVNRMLARKHEVKKYSVEDYKEIASKYQRKLEVLINESRKS